MDVFTDVLNTMHLQSQVHYAMKLTAPWGIKAPAMYDSALFFAVMRGSCYLAAECIEMPVSLVGGDLVMLPQGNAHTLYDQPGSTLTPLEKLPGACPIATGERQDFQFGGGGSLTSMVVGRFIFDNQVSKPFLSGLPSIIHLQGERGQMAPWLETTLKWMASETSANNAGSPIMVSRLTDMLFIQILRAYLDEQVQENGRYNGSVGWLRAIADPVLGKAFELIHQKPEHPWTVAELAKHVNMSRTSFSTRFSGLAGVPPLTYLTKWRMLKASDILRQKKTTITEAAMNVGYESEAAFSKAFKRELGVSPGAYRREKAKV